MKASDHIKAVQKLIEAHGDLNVMGTFHVFGNKQFGKANVILSSKTNYATPKPYKVTKHFEVVHCDFAKESKE